MIFGCVLVGLVYLASKYRNDLIRKVENIYKNVVNYETIIFKNDTNNNVELNEEKDLVSSDKIIIADSLEKCDYAVQRICSNSSDGILGFDCEWINEGPVSLLQLATDNGTCALFRLGKIGCVPPKLQELLADDCILKVGVAPFEDGIKLSRDYGCWVVGTVDLRVLAEALGKPSRKSLAALCLQYLGLEMDKILEVRCGNWNADILTPEQIEYAAYDAIASVQIYHQIREDKKKMNLIWRFLAVFIRKKWGRMKAGMIYNLPETVIDTRYRGSVSHKTTSNYSMTNENNIIQKRPSPLKPVNNTSKCAIPTRKEPLYHNCYLEAPDGELLCTCDRKKAEWYIFKNLGKKVQDEPLTVRLNFEPAGRALGEVGQYYIQVKVNQCVVCGAKDKFIKKNVVPKEYRKYFPLIMKAHQSHDVLLLCPACHEISNRNDVELRKKLAVMCDAPLSRSVSTNCDRNKLKNQQRRKQFLSAVNALQKRNNLIPSYRKKELETHILDYAQQYYSKSYGSEIMSSNRITDELVTSLKSPEESKFIPHSEKVVQYFTEREGGLVILERMWREHFLNKMQPKYLPSLWSVDHNQERLEIRVAQNRIEPGDAKIAGLLR